MGRAERLTTKTVPGEALAGFDSGSGVNMYVNMITFFQTLGEGGILHAVTFPDSRIVKFLYPRN